MVLEVEVVVEQPLEVVGLVFIIGDGSLSVISVPEGNTGIRRDVVIALVVVVIYRVSEGGAQLLVLLHKDVVLHCGASEQISAVTVAGEVGHTLERVARSGRRSRLIPAAVFIVNGHGGVHGEGGVKHAVVAVNLVHLAGAEGEVHLHAVVQDPLLNCGAAAEFFAGVGEVKAGSLLVEGGCIVGALLGTAVNGDVLVEFIGEIIQQQLVPVGAGAVVVATAAAAEFIGGEHLGNVLSDVVSEVGIIAHVSLSDFTAALLGGDEDYAVSTARTVNCRRCSILEDGHAFDVLRGDIADVASGDAVDDDERLIACLQGGCATDLER